MNVFLDVTGPRLFSPYAIAEEAARATGVPLDEIYGRGRTARLAHARHIAMWLVRKCTRLSLMEIGEHFGGRDHGTVIHACRNVDSWMQQDAAFAARMNQMKEQFTNN